MVRRFFGAVVFLICFAVLASAASAAMPWADPSGALCRVAITRDGADVREDPCRGSKAVFKASEGAEYIACRHVVTHAGEEGDGSQWYELIGMAGPSGRIAPSLAGRSAKGALGFAPLYVLAESARELPLRDGDAEAVREMQEQNWGEPDDADGGKTPGAARLWAAVSEYAGRGSLETMARHGEGATVRNWYDSDSEYFFGDVITETFFESYGHAYSDTFIAVPGAELAGLVIGRSSEADARALLGAPTGTYEIKGGMYSREFYKLNLSGGVGVYGSEEIERVVSVRAARVISYGGEESEGVYLYIGIYIGEDGIISAITTEYMNTIA